MKGCLFYGIGFFAVPVICVIAGQAMHLSLMYTVALIFIGYVIWAGALLRDLFS